MNAIQNPNRVTRPSLPYLNNLQTVLITLAANFVLVFVFNFKMAGYDVYGIAIDAVICAMLTAAIDVLIVQASMKKAWAAGAVPKQVPVSKLMMRLPKRGIGLMLIFGGVFAVICAAINCGLFLYYGFETWTFWQFMLYKLVYSLILSERLVSMAILRMVQEDCDPRRGASAAGKEAEAQ